MSKFSDREGAQDTEPDPVCPTCDGTGEVPLKDLDMIDKLIARVDAMIDGHRLEPDDLVPCPDCEEEFLDDEELERDAVEQMRGQGWG